MRPLLILLPLLAAHAADVCNPADLAGPYVFQLSGTTSISGSPKPTASLGRIVFDGKGNLTGTASATFAGFLLGNPVTGTYEAKTDCSVTWKLQDDSGAFQSFAGKLSPDAAAAQFSQTGGPSRGILKKLPEKCAPADLLKTYSFTASGSTTPMLEGQIGQTVSSRGTLDVAANGTFQLETDCSVTFQLPLLSRVGGDVQSSAMNMRGFLVNHGKEILAFQTDPGAMVAAHLTSEDSQPINSR